MFRKKKMHSPKFPAAFYHLKVYGHVLAHMKGGIFLLGLATKWWHKHRGHVTLFHMDAEGSYAIAHSFPLQGNGVTRVALLVSSLKLGG